MLIAIAPVEPLALVVPVAMVNAPEPLLEDPVLRMTAPELPPPATPEAMIIRPLAPLAVVPEEKSRAPDCPLLTELPDLITTVPELDEVPDPDWMVTKPPVFTESPPRMTMAPPMEVALVPTTTLMEPLEPPVALPV